MSTPDTPAYEPLKGVLATNFAGQALSLDESVERVISGMETDLADLGEGNYNGTPIKERQLGQIPSYYQASLHKVLDASKKVMAAMVKNQGWGKIDIAHDDRSRFGTHTADLNALEQRLTGAVNTWLNTVQERGLVDKVGLPLPSRLQTGEVERLHPTRVPDEDGKLSISGLSDVMRLSDEGYVPRNFVTNETAIRGLNAERAPARTGQRMDA
jgi:hypothetical protein